MLDLEYKLKILTSENQTLVQALEAQNNSERILEIENKM